jgi:DNA-3-methyladenine glycosylase
MDPIVEERCTPRSDDVLGSGFFSRPCAEVALALLGRWVQHGDVVLEITETEAYLGPHDTACHTAKGRTARNAAMWGPVGRAYVYRCYGLHWMLNVVSGTEGGGAAVLIRSAAPVRGEAVWLPRRSGRRDLAGPGKVAAALGVERANDGDDLTDPAGLSLRWGRPATAWLHGPRVGVDYAAPADREALLRFAVADERRVSARKTLSSPG